MRNLLDLLKNKRKFFLTNPFKVFVMQYPSPQEWKKVLNISDFLDEVLSLQIKDINFYIHIPFCDYICKYCSFSKILYKENFLSEYFKRLEEEIRFWDKILNFRKIKIKTIFIWWGTPTVLSERYIYRLWEIFYKYWIFTGWEFTIETNPDRIKRNTFKAWRDIWVNRISIWVQTFDRSILSRYWRNYIKLQHLIDKIEILKGLWYWNFNLDFIYGFEGQDLKSIERDLLNIFKILPTHLSFYPLILYNKKVNVYQLADFFDKLEKNYNFILEFLRNKYKFYTLEYATLIWQENKQHIYQVNYLSGENVLWIWPSAFSFLGYLWFKNNFTFFKRLNSKFFVDLYFNVRDEKLFYERLFIMWLRLNKFQKEVVDKLLSFYGFEIEYFVKNFCTFENNFYYIRNNLKKYQNLLIYYFYNLFRW